MGQHRRFVNRIRKVDPGAHTSCTTRAYSTQRLITRLITLARIWKLLDVRTCLLIYKQTILPIFDYVYILVNSSTQRKIAKLQPLQNKAVKIIEKLDGYVSTADMKSLHDKLNLKMLTDRRKMFMLKMIYKQSKDPENVNTYRPGIVLRTGPKVKMKLAFTDKDRVYKSPYYLCNQLWNKLDSKIQLSTSLIEFRESLKKIDLSEL